MKDIIVFVKKIAPFFVDVWQYLIIVLLFIIAAIFYL
jgi:hypothetical protein